MVTLSLDWLGDLHFKNSSGSPAIELKSSDPTIASPPQALAYAVMGCMAMDVVHVLEKGRHRITALRVTCIGHRAVEHPRRFVAMALHFDVAADVEGRIVERAIELSRTKYCSVWHTVRPDVDLQTTYQLRPASAADATTLIPGGTSA